MNDVAELFEMRCHWIGGRWARSRGTALFEVRDPATEEVIGHVAGGTPVDVDEAVAAAQQALPAWQATSLQERLELLERLCQAVEARSDQLAEIITTEVGAPVGIAGPAHVGFTVDILRSAIEVAKNFHFQERRGAGLVWRESVGTAVLITPWNLPLILVAQKLGSALAAGCTLILKPSELTPFNALMLAWCTSEAGFPNGVFNVVTGDGPATGEVLVQHPGVDKVAFTGSTRAGRRVASLAAGAVKRVSLELGGKSANLLLPDGDLERAVATGVQQACFNSGQSCIAWSRLLVPADRASDALDLAAAEMSRLRVGDPWKADTDLGPLVSRAALDRVRGYIHHGIDQGARLVMGGLDRPDVGEGRGHYVAPTLFADVTPEMAIAQEEIFGPVLSLIPYRTEAEAIAVANGTSYGLHGAVWSADEAHALEVARQLRTGMLNVNGYHFDPAAPFGGYKQSGIGRELGPEGLEEFLETKSLHVAHDES